MDTSNLKLPALAFGGGLATGLIMSSVAKKLKNSQDEFSPDKIPEKWVRVGEISDLIIYPVKSMPGIKVDKALCTGLGLQDATNPSLRDRTFLVTDSKGNFQTQRQIPQMALIFPSLTEDIMNLNYVGNNSLESKVSFKIPKDDGTNKRTVRIWSDRVQALNCGEKVGKWLDKITGSKGLQLFYHPATECFRTVAADQKAFPAFRQKDTGVFHDETSYMLMTEESLLELNGKMSRKMSERSFRPSMMLKNAPEPWSEDFWTFIRIGGDSKGSPIFKTSRPCVRCKMTTIDPDTGNIIEDGEPLKTLTSLKRSMRDPTVTKIVKNSAVMGAHFGMLKNEGSMISVGDAVYTAVL